MQAVIFDFDGTIADTGHIWDKVDRFFFEKRGIPFPEDYADAIGTMSFDEGAIYTKNKYSLPDSVEQIQNEWNNYALKAYTEIDSLKAGVREYIFHLKKKGIKIGLATASNPEYYTPVLKKTQTFDCFDAFAHGKDGVRGKDYPDIYKLCAERLQIEPENCLLYEDVLNGIVSAKKIGMKVTAVYDNQPKKRWEQIKKEADGFVNSFEEIKF
ncbi:MAG TPA: hypothetical protein DCG28_02905 [Lachnospiraceae bacterium]|nr:hypothetical protein [Lachnospiraceae bacterium]